MRRFCSSSLALMVVTLLLAGVVVTLLAPAHRVGSQETSSAVTVLDRKVAVYVPGTVNVSRLAPEVSERMTHQALERFSSFFGGATMVPATGAWLSKSGLVKEPVQIVYSFTQQRTLDDKLVEVLALARELCDKMGQESVCLEINGRLYFVDQTTKSLR